MGGAGRPLARRPPQLHPLRLLPAGLPHLPRDRAGARVAARPAAPDPRRRGGARGADRRAARPPRPLPAVPGLRDRVSLRRPLRAHHGGRARLGHGPADGGRPGPAVATPGRVEASRAPAAAGGGAAARAARALSARPALRPLGAAAPPARAPRPSAPRLTAPARGAAARPLAGPLPRLGAARGPRGGGQARGLAHRLHPRRVLPRDAPGDGARARPARHRGRGARGAAMLRGAPRARRRRRGGARARAREHRRLRGGRRGERRRQRRRLRRLDEGVRAAAAPRRRLG